MSKREKQNKSTNTIAKRFGRSYGELVIDPVIGDKVTQKVMNARKLNNPKKYK